MGLRQPPSLTPSIDLIPSPLCLPDHPCAAIALALWQAAISYAGKGVSESTEVYRAWKAAEGYPKYRYLEHVCGKDGSVKLVKKTSVCVEIRTEDRPKKIGWDTPPDY